MKLTINELNIRMQEFDELKHKWELDQLELARLRDLLAKRDAEILSLKAKIQEMADKLMEYENKIAMLSGENKRLSNLLERRGSELDDLNVRLSVHGSDLDRNKDQLGAKDREIAALKLTINQLNIRIQEIEGQWSLEKSGLLKQIEDLTLKITSITASFNLTIEGLQGELNVSKELVLRLQKENEDLLLRIRELEALVEKLKKEIEEKKAKIIELQNTIMMLSSELSRVKKVNEKNRIEIDDTGRRVRELEDSNGGMSRSITELETRYNMVTDKHFMGLELIVRMAAEIEGLRERFVEKIDLNR